ncbi:hypothetical protein Kpol_289p3 [Vanderwaltozyma polyspora DSM 70294]|uniref:Protein YTP1-like C-terminal domain-containing protein n=1 Tax=Vanderwaltozyma polyspora (strain ATCC 22028 / DSM 70294 / BCRC 21397 / CBS 2163 / NBRC 10782 / NRRL Y-8283 / UCD 57-17) TaxID=436907 RepID=A7TT31_VANPO|nr:uncharacterized protein Kpol_289p3 [Vanderwaltozyma polyspora DSM 70294]EDO14578.1 hypothetical protein Kpol_289p3 [Vanderwaltozyma polyspora DSM 70294]
MLISYKLHLVWLSLAIGSALAHDGHHDETMSSAQNMNNDNNQHLIANTTINIIPTPYPMTHAHGLPILQHSDLNKAQRLYWESYNTTTYFTTDAGNKFALKYHILTITSSLFFLYPICLMLNNISSGWYIPVLTLHFITILSSLFSLSIFLSSLSNMEDLYPNNLYKKSSIILLFLISLHYFSAIISKTFKWLSNNYKFDNDKQLNTNSFIPLDSYDHDNTSDSSNFISDVTPENDIDSTLTIQDNPIDIEHSPSSLRGVHGSSTRFNNGKGAHNSKLALKISNIPIIRRISLKFGMVFNLLFNILNYPMLVYLFFNFTTGLAVGNLFGKAQRIFNLLAHWIKGGVFVILGVISLARYCGFGAKWGWAWNKVIIYNNEFEKHKLFSIIPIPRGTITMEGIESFLIFFYGSTNVFLEHLAGAGGAWSAKDLQHVSIAFMFIGTGLCGLLAEFKLNKLRYIQASQYLKDQNSIDSIYAFSPGYSMNPFPAFTIFWTGILMSQHAQASQTSTSVHIQWGNLLSYGSFFRLFTFLILYFEPKSDFETPKPFTELITSFCMLAGGLIFMESTDQVIEGMEYRGYTPMFTFNISVGMVTLVMAWEMIIFFWRDYLKTRR